MIHVERQQTWSSVSWLDYKKNKKTNSSARVQICLTGSLKQSSTMVPSRGTFCKFNNIKKAILRNPSILNRRVSKKRDSKVKKLTGGSSRMRGNRARTVPRGERPVRAGPTRYGWNIACPFLQYLIWLQKALIANIPI